MNRYDCDTVRDLLPAFVRGELLPLGRHATRQHLDACADCRAEADVVLLIQTTLDPLPAGLEGRVLRAVRTAPARRPRRWAPARLAMAATLAAAVLGGSLALERFGAWYGDDGVADAEAEGGALLSWIAMEDDLMLHSGTMLQELTVEELELLLEELDS